MKIKTYIKKPIEIEAIKFTGRNQKDILKFIGDNYDTTLNYPNIKTLEGVMRVSEGDYIIKGVEGEFYPCKPDIFKKTYEEKNKPLSFKNGKSVFKGRTIYQTRLGAERMRIKGDRIYYVANVGYYLVRPRSRSFWWF